MPNLNKKYRKDIGDLVHQITIQRKVIYPPINGIVEEVWETIYAPRCSVNNNTGKEILQQNVEIYGVESKKFTFRTHPTLEIKQKDIIIYKNEKWEIISVYDFDDNNILTVAIAKKVFQ